MKEVQTVLKVQFWSFFLTIFERFTESIHWWMMDDGWWKKVQKIQKVYIDELWMMEKSTESTESIHWWMMVESTESTEWDTWMKHFYEPFLWDILMRHFDEILRSDILMRHIDCLWRTLMTCNAIWYGDDFNGMTLWQFYCLLLF